MGGPMSNPYKRMLERLHQLARLHERDALPPELELEALFGPKGVTGDWQNATDVQIRFYLN